MRLLLLVPLLALAALPVAAEDPVNEAVVKDTRAVYAATRKRDRDSAMQKLFSRSDLDFRSIKAGLIAGRYYRDPLVTAYGVRHSGKHLSLRLRGDDSKERGFSLYVPKAYKAKTKIAVLFYLHHGASARSPNAGATNVHSALARLKGFAEDYGVLIVAPYTSAGAEWWMPEGKRLVKWTLDKVKERYNIDEDRVALMGPQDGAEGVWTLGQEMPGTWSCLIPMSGNPYEVTAILRPLFLGTLDRMDVLMGLPGKLQGSLGDANTMQMLAGLAPMMKQGLRITTALAPRSTGGFGYLERVAPQVMTWVLTKKRKARADEVDIEHDGALRSLWLESHGVDMAGAVAGNLPTTRLVWAPPKKQAGSPKIGIGQLKRPKHWKVGIRIGHVGPRTPAMAERLLNGDIIVEVGKTPVNAPKEVADAIKAQVGGEVRLLLVREIKEDRLEGMQKQQAFYVKQAAERRRLRAAGKKVPDGFMDYVEEDDDEGDEEDDDEGCTTIDMGGGNAGGDGGKGGDGDDKAKTVMFAFERFVLPRLFEPMNIARADFGARRVAGDRGEGVRVGVIPGSLAHRSGMRGGDRIVAVGSDPVKSAKDIRKFFETFKFEKAPKGERFVEFTVKRGGHGQNGGGGGQTEQTVHVEWEPVQAGRVDAKWLKKESALFVVARYCKGFTVYFTDEQLKPGKDFHLFINSIPYRDLVDPASTPKYPRMRPGMSTDARDRLLDLRLARSKVKGWQPDLKFMVKTALDWRDRSLVVGAKLSVDLTALKAGFDAVRRKGHGHGNKRAERIRKAYEEFRAKDQG